jgi:elongation factor G
MGDVIGDLNHRRGRVEGMDSTPKGEVIRAHVPMSETLKYSSDLRSITGGRGSFSIEFSHYDELPGHLMDKVIAVKMAAEEDESKRRQRKFGRTLSLVDSCSARP